MRKLTLKKETLTELDSEALSGVVGGTFKTKYDCTESYQVCNPLSVKVCVNAVSILPCLPTWYCQITQNCG